MNYDELVDLIVYSSYSVTEEQIKSVLTEEKISLQELKKNLYEKDHICCCKCCGNYYEFDNFDQGMSSNFCGHDCRNDAVEKSRV